MPKVVRIRSVVSKAHCGTSILKRGRIRQESNKR